MTGKIHLRIILRNGVEFTMKVDKYTAKWNDSGLTNFQYEGCVENAPIYLNLSEVLAIVRVMSNEIEEEEVEDSE